jgi:hypothetical protein
MMAPNYNEDFIFYLRINIKETNQHQLSDFNILTQSFFILESQRFYVDKETNYQKLLISEDFFLIQNIFQSKN